MKRTILALLALLAAAPSLAAVATVKTALNSSTWTDLGAGPAMIGANGSVVFVIDDVTPVTTISQGFVLGVAPQCVNTTSHVWAMSANSFPAWVFVSPIAAC
jgi:hypothetical protein